MCCYTQCPQPGSRPPLTHASTGDFWTLTGKSGSVSCVVTAPFSWVLMHTRFCLCLSRVSVSPVLWKFCNEFLLTLKFRFPGDTQSTYPIPRLESLLWGLELSQKCENFFGIIVFQFVSHLAGSFIVDLMVTSFKRIYATCCASQDCCCQSLCPHGRPLLTHASAGAPQTVKGRSVSVSYGVLLFSLHLGVHKVLSVPSKHLWQV